MSGRKHDGTIADATDPAAPPLVVTVIGHRPEHQPYLAIQRPGNPRETVATITNANALRGLVRRILKALEAPR